MLKQKIETMMEKVKMDAANEIADQFTLGFFDDRMVSDVATIIGKHIEKFSTGIAVECSELISLQNCISPFTNNGYGVGYVDGRNDAAYMIQTQFEKMLGENNVNQ